MSLDALIMLAGALVAVVPFLGFPVTWHGPIFFALGVIVIGLGIIVRRRGTTAQKPHSGNVSIESAPRLRIVQEDLASEE